MGSRIVWEHVSRLYGMLVSLREVLGTGRELLVMDEAPSRHSLEADCDLKS